MAGTNYPDIVGAEEELAGFQSADNHKLDRAINIDSRH